MTKLYESPRATLHLADARDVLPTVPTESVDLVVTDPPYGVEWVSNRRAESFDMLTGDTMDDRPGITEVLTDAVRCVGQHRHLYVFGPADLLDGLKVTEAVELIWDKGGPGAGDMAAPWGPQHERVSFTVSKFRHAGEAGATCLPARMRKGTVLSFARPTGRNVRHPSEKPVPLLRELIESSSRAGDLVLDPFAGVGSTGVAAILSGRRALLIEVDEKYAAIAIDRLRQADTLADAMEIGMTRRRRSTVPPIPDQILDQAGADFTDLDHRARAAITARQAWEEAHRHPVKAASNRATMLLRLEDLTASAGTVGSPYPPAAAENRTLRIADAQGRVAGYTAGLASAGACQRCGRALRDPVSVARSVGPDCWADGYRPAMVPADD